MKAKIRHMAIFNLKYPADDPRTAAFFKAAEKIFQIPAVYEGMQCNEVSPKNGYSYCFSFDFLSEGDYQSYNVHPDHVAFVSEYWERDVEEFMEVDLSER